MQSRTLVPAALCLALAAAAQQTARPAFEVVSLKHSGDIQSTMVREGNRTHSTARPSRFTGDSVSAKVPLMNILTEAFQLKPFQIQGPEWMTTEVYDVQARMPGHPTRSRPRHVANHARRPPRPQTA